MKRHAATSFFLGVTPIAILGWCGTAGAAPLNYSPPPETASLHPGAGVDVTTTNCRVCHSLDYITTQPRGQTFGKDFWTAEITKMIKVYGASISDTDAATIVNYLTSTYQ
jgi:sulfite dehydrogenase (cytochrome) subunit B